MLLKSLSRLALISSILIFSSLDCQAQSIEGTVLEAGNKTALPYVNIFIKKSNRGTITNESGTYSLNTKGLQGTDTISFQFIGFKTVNTTYEQLTKNPTLLLTTDVMSIDEVVITNKQLKVEDIVKNVLKNKELNYNTNFQKTQIFSRERYITDVNKIELDYKKSTIEELSEETIRNFEEKMPKTSTSYFDFLADFYFNGQTSSFKIEPIQAVELISKDLAELANYEDVFNSLFADTKDKEYWKIKSGIFGEKIDYEQDTTDIPENADSRPLSYFKAQLKEKSNYVTLEDKNLWEFLHKTGRYNFELEGSTSVNNESVYIISFTPKKKGKYVGKVFISTETFALLKASYEYADGKRGKNFNFLGVGYTENGFKGSIYFEKENDTYQLKYFSFNKNYNIRIDRKIALQKRKNRFLFDKTLKELKIGLNLNLQVQEAIEYFAIKTETIDEEKFDGFTEKKTFNVIHIDQFDENLWKGYDIIEPTKKLKGYKKLK